jgi:hypothetical protein
MNQMYVGCAPSHVHEKQKHALAAPLQCWTYSIQMAAHHEKLMWGKMMSVKYAAFEA